MRKSTAFRNKKRNFHFPAIIVLTALIVCSLSVYASETEKHGAIIRLDDDGYLYYMNCEKDYYGPEVMDAMRKIKP